MHLIDDIDAVPAFCRRVLHLFPDITDIFHTVVGRSIDLHYIQGRTRSDIFTGLALPTGTSVHRVFTVDRSGKYLRDTGFSCSSSSAKQIRMTDTAGCDLIF